MKSYTLRNILVAVAASMATWSANADTQLTIKYDTAYKGDILLAGAPGRLGGPQGETAYLTALQATYKSGDALALPSRVPFNTFCFDIGPALITSGSWQATALPTGPNGNTIPYVNGGLERAASIYSAYVGGVNITTTQGQRNGAALQLAIWNDLYDGDNSVKKGAFRVRGGNLEAVEDLADAILQSKANVANPNLDLTFWDATGPVDNQDFISLQPNGFIPEPGTYATAAFACACLGLQSIRASQKRR